MADAKQRYFFTSESVTEGHPDKMADQVSDAILDSLLEKDPNSRVAVESLLTTGLVLVAGEVTTNAYIEIPEIVRKTVQDIGYDDAAYGFDCHTCSVLTAIHSQSPDIAMGVDREGAGDQGLMFGYATDETPELMPLPIALAHRLCRKLAEVRKGNILPYLRPDGKSQVTVEYEDGRPVRVDAVVVSSQHAEYARDLTHEKLRQDVVDKVIKPVIPARFDDGEIKYHINPTGQFVQGGPAADTGLTGRKIIVDTYGGMGRHGGGAFSGKDPTKVDRSGAYMARYVAKNIVAAGLAKRCEIQVAYAIGVAEPVSIRVDTFGTGAISEQEIEHLVRNRFDFRPRAMIETLKLRRPIYRATAAYGHFGRDEEGFTWEMTNAVADLKAAVK
ncbi:MAG: methionine adenosyltransferase [Candidatus Eisenbacteria bacterium]|nr:methionine adenosyltransferase [Candidatus Eisenbacteria bacterium]